MGRRKNRPPISVSLDRLEERHASGLDADGVRWKVRAAPVGAAVRAQPGRKQTARRLGIDTPAPDQVEPTCPAFGMCGGCQLQEMPLSSQRREKRAMLERLLGFPVPPLRGAPDGYRYRNKLELSFGPRAYVPEADKDAPMEEGAFLGLHPPGWFSKIVPLEGCPLGTAAMNRVIAEVVAAGLAPAWDNRTHTGVWRHLVLRDGGSPQAPQVLASLVTSSAADPDAVRALGDRIGALPGVRGVLWIVTDRQAEVSTGELREVLVGVANVAVDLGRVTLRLPHDAFFQVNTSGARVLFDEIEDLLPETTVIADLYCGVGAIGLSLAAAEGGPQRVIGVETVPAAIECARENAASMGVSGEWHVGRVEDLLDGLDLPEDCALIVDPPRAGLHPRAARFLAGFGAQTLIYVACSPRSLVRDRAVLEAGGWRLDAARGVDLFPQTLHLEVVARFVRG